MGIDCALPAPSLAIGLDAHASWNTSDMADLAEACEALRRAGAKFAYLHGSQAWGDARPDSDVDVAAYFGDPVPASFDVTMPDGVDLLVLDDAPLEIAGRIALDGQLILEVDQVARVRWESSTRRIYLDEKYRIDRSHREFLESLPHG